MNQKCIYDKRNRNFSRLLYIQVLFYLANSSKRQQDYYFSIETHDRTMYGWSSGDEPAFGSGGLYCLVELSKFASVKYRQSASI